MEEKGKKNAYDCGTCGGRIVTVNIDEGVTPFMLGCRATPGCGGMMMSQWYRIDQELKPNYEWFRPDVVTEYDEELKEHVRQGGLILRPVVVK